MNVSTLPIMLYRYRATQPTEIYTPRLFFFDCCVTCGTTHRQCATIINHLQICGTGIYDIIASACINSCTYRSHSNLIITAISMNDATKPYRINRIIVIISNIITRKKIFNTPPDALTHKLPSYSSFKLKTTVLFAHKYPHLDE